jgi:hypothetical protein
MSDPAFRRSARLGDGHIFIGGYRAACGAWTRIERYLIEAGRDPKYFGRELIIGVPADDKTPKAMAEMVEKWKKAGGTHASIVTMGKGIKTVQAHIDYFAEVRKLIGSTVSN